MATGGQKRTRSERVAALELPPGQWERAWIGLRRRDVLGRIALALVAAAAICLAIHAWDPPFAYRIGHVPMRDIVAGVPFTQDDPAATLCRPAAGPQRSPLDFHPGREPLEQLRASLYNTVVDELIATTEVDEVEQDAVAASFSRRCPPARRAAAALGGAAVPGLPRRLHGPENLARFKQAFGRRAGPLRATRPAEQAAHTAGQGSRPAGLGNQEEILRPIRSASPSRRRSSRSPTC